MPPADRRICVLFGRAFASVNRGLGRDGAGQTMSDVSDVAARATT